MINYIKGDATNPIGEGNKILVHICNDIGAWGRGFVLAISKKWQDPENEYRKWSKSQIDFSLGNVQFIQVEKDLTIANLIGQSGIFSVNSIPPIRYEAVEAGLYKVAIKAKDINAEVHMPRIGCGLAGGDWKEVEKLILRTLINKCINVFVYDLE